jgi:hypothetical protein
MPDVISEYQKWKQQGQDLKMQAKEAMEARFRELLSEAVTIAEEYRADFGAPLKPPPPVTAFRYKAAGKSKAKKTSKQTKAEAAAPARADAKPHQPDPKIVRLQQRLAAAKKKLEDAKAAGGATRPLEDRIYEIEDALRLAENPA